jgi:branched-chain amino acid transport system permease protein
MNTAQTETPTATEPLDASRGRANPGALLRLGLFGALALVVLIAVPLTGDSALMRTLIEFFSLLALAQLWNLLAGYAGIVSIGQQAWIGLGAYAMLVLADDAGINVFIAAVLGGAFCALVAVPTAAVIFRLRGAYLSVGTWVMAEVYRLLVSSSNDWLKGEYGRTLASVAQYPLAQREVMIYLFAVLVGLGSIALVYGLARTRTGLGLAAIRDSETAAATLGVSTRRLKLFIYILCAAGTGIVGGLIYMNLLRIAPEPAFSVQWTAFMIFIVVIGGIGTVEGPIIGAVIFFFIREYLSNFGEWSFIILGVAAVVMMLAAPQGVWGIVHNRFGVELFPVRRRLPRGLD